MKLINKFLKGKKFSNTPTGRAMQKLYDLEHGITMQKALPEVEVFPNLYDIDNNGYGNSFALPLEQRPAIFSLGEISQPYVPKKLDELGWLNRTFGINNFGLGIREFIGNPANVVPTGQIIQGIKTLTSVSNNAKNIGQTISKAKRAYNTPKINIMSSEGDITTSGNDYRYLQQDANKSFDLINEHSPSRQLPYTELEIRELPLEYRANARRGNKKFQFRNLDMMEDYFSDSYEFNNNLLDYINNLNIEIAPQFKPLVTDGVVERNPYVAAYRNYLYQNNTDAVSISDDDIAKFLTHMHNMQQQGVTGKMADKLPLWHGSNDMFDVFDWHNTGKYTGNSGALGPGNYFSSHGALYGKPQESNWLPINFQPYYITGIKSTPSGHMMIEKGILPDYMNKQMVKNNPKVFQAMFTRSVPGANTTLYIDPNEAVQGVFSGDKAAFMLRRNTGIKSLFPHPSRLIRNEDGTVQLLPTNWSDPRVNFALGGKLIKHIRK